MKLNINYSIVKYQLLTVVLITTSILTGRFCQAQQKTDPQELYSLCAKFPLNSRCEGIGKPIPLKARKGKEVVCNFTFNPGIFEQPQRYSVVDDVLGLKDLGIMQPGGCKLVASREGLVVYQEQGEEIELLEDKRSTSETKIQSDRIFISNYQVWNKIHRWELGFLPYSNSKQTDRTNFLVILLDEKTAETLVREIELLSAYEPELLDQITPNSHQRSPALKRLRETNECQNCDLSNVDLSDANLQDANLEGANLAGANLEGANLRQVNLKNAYLLKANLQQADLTEAKLDGANLTLAALNESILTDADLKGVNLQQANLQQADLTEANLSAPSLLQEANLTNANLSDANLQGANFNRANLSDANLAGADLSQTDIQLNDIPNNYSLLERAADFAIGLPIFSFISGGVDFATNLSNANLQGANLSDTDLDKVNWKNVNLTDTNFSNSNFEAEKLEEVALCNVTLADGSTSDRNCQ